MTQQVIDTDVLRRSVTREEVAQAKQTYMWLGSWMIPQPLIALPPEPPDYWSHARDDVLLSTQHAEDKWTNAVAIAATKCASLDYDVESDVPLRMNRSHDILSAVDGMQGWSPFIAKHVQDFLCTDNGAFVEIVRTSKSIGSRIVGLLHLDSRRCFRTGDPEIPVLYRDRLGAIHELRAHQVIAICDMPTPRLTFNGVGLCAASRAYRTIYRMAVIETYIAEKVSGRKPLAVHLLSGMSPKQLQEVFQAAQGQADAKGLTTYMGAAATAVPTDGDISIVTIPFSELPDGFDLEKERSNARLEYANTIGLDIQDLQPGAIGGSLGSSTQSQVLNEKAKGKGLAYWRKAWTEQVNLKVLPDATTFIFVEKDFRADTDEANAANARQTSRAGMISASMITPEQGLQMAVDAGDAPREFLPADATPGGAISSAEKPVDEEAQTGTDVQEVEKPEAEQVPPVKGATAKAWDESKHPRNPSGDSSGGEFAGAGGSNRLDPDAPSSADDERAARLKPGDTFTSGDTQYTVEKVRVARRAFSYPIDDTDPSSPEAEHEYSIVTVTGSNNWGQQAKFTFGGLDRAMRDFRASRTTKAFADAFKGYNPTQERAPKGADNGGQWVKEDGKSGSASRSVADWSKKKWGDDKGSNFAHWFGNSKIVDSDGIPLVVYHGSDEEFDNFDPSKIGKRDAGDLGHGFYFSTDPEVGRTNTNIKPVYLRASNPLELKYKKFGDNKKGIVLSALGLPPGTTSKEITKALAKKGHDSVILDYSPTGYGHRELVVFSPNQIKSATGNAGSFDPGNERATKATRTELARLSPEFTRPRMSKDGESSYLSQVTNELRAYMQTLAEKCREYCPEDSGTLKESIRAQVLNANTSNAEGVLYAGNAERPEVVVRSNLFGRRGFGPKDPDGVLAFEGEDGDTVFTAHVDASQPNDWFGAAWKETEPDRRAMARRIGALGAEKIAANDVRLSNAEHIDGYDDNRGDTIPNTARNRGRGGVMKEWDESKHPRNPAGDSGGGEFASDGGAHSERYLGTRAGSRARRLIDESIALGELSYSADRGIWESGTLSGKRAIDVLDKKRSLVSELRSALDSDIDHLMSAYSKSGQPKERASILPERQMKISAMEDALQHAGIK